MSIVACLCCIPNERAKIGDGGILERQNFTELSFGTYLNVKLGDCKPARTSEQMPK